MMNEMTWKCMDNDLHESQGQYVMNKVKQYIIINKIVNDQDISKPQIRVPSDLIQWGSFYQYLPYLPFLVKFPSKSKSKSK